MFYKLQGIMDYITLHNKGYIQSYFLVQTWSFLKRPLIA